MKKLVGSRGTGKTTALIDFAASNGYLIITTDYIKLKEKVISLGYPPNIVLEATVENLMKLSNNKIPFVVDDIDLVLNSLTNGRLRNFTLTID